jgi:hypothetical protein
MGAALNRERPCLMRPPEARALAGSGAPAALNRDRPCCMRLWASTPSAPGGVAEAALNRPRACCIWLRISASPGPPRADGAALNRDRAPALSSAAPGSPSPGAANGVARNPEGDWLCPILGPSRGISSTPSFSARPSRLLTPVRPIPPGDPCGAVPGRFPCACHTPSAPTAGDRGGRSAPPAVLGNALRWRLALSCRGARMSRRDCPFSG